MLVNTMDKQKKVKNNFYALWVSYFFSSNLFHICPFKLVAHERAAVYGLVYKMAIQGLLI